MKGNKFNKILAEHQQRIYSLALYILRDKHEAEDITQDVFTRLWNNIEQVEFEKTETHTWKRLTIFALSERS